MFFGFSTTATHSSKFTENSFQIWETQVSFDSLFMLKGKNPGGKALSAIVDIYNYYYPSDKKDDEEYINLKKSDSIERRRIIRKIKSCGLKSWVCSLENNAEMELFIFGSIKDNASILKFVENIDCKDYIRLKNLDTFNYETLDRLLVVKSKAPIRSSFEPFDPLSAD